MNLFVGNINTKVSDHALKALFTEFGEVESVRILTDRFTGESKGFGFVSMQNEQQAFDAMRQLTNAEFFGRRLVVTKAVPKSVR